jgi:hypothetical protein
MRGKFSGILGAAKKYRDMVKTLGPAQGDMTPCPAK